MASDDPTPSDLATSVTIPAPAPSPQPEAPAGRVHLVVVTTHTLDGAGAAPGSPALRTRFWHPRDNRWSENDFDSLEHALRLFVDESGWLLLQDQGLDDPLAREWIFQAHRIDFTRPTQEQILSDIGMTPEHVTRLLKDV